MWLITHFTTSPVLIALMQTATTLPVVLAGLFAGALADIVHHRRVPLASQGPTLGAAAALGVLTYAGLLNAPRLLGSILGTLAWQALNAELVTSDELPAAVTLSSVSYNLASAVGGSRSDGGLGERGFDDRAIHTLPIPAELTFQG